MKPESDKVALASAHASAAAIAELLFVIEAALPFVEAQVDGLMCSSSGGPDALRAILKKYDWNNERRKWTGLPPNDPSSATASQ